ncbi:MAG: 2,3-bisphosphoglycerate-independent phosphoglycerate mutase [Saprospiraceae bacterium]|jgi:2,3-bisphosphoglycerate-independent phosphoglycerate mutase
MRKTKKSLLVILDGWGLGQVPEADAVANANTPYFDSLMSDYPNASLVTYGMEVGLPEGQMGNSEVGHLNIGAGRIVYQELARINKAIQDDSLKDTTAIKEAISYAKTQNKTLHLMGLVSDGGVHSHVEHLKALVTLLDDAGVDTVKIHAFTDGRDTDPKGGIKYLKEIEDHTQGTTAKIATVIGRYYAMDRDERWERIKKAYDLMVKGIGTYSTNLTASLQAAYDAGQTDEFVDPIVLDKEGLIKEDDVVLFFNFRTDRPRQITRVLTQEDKEDFGMHTLPLYFVTMVNYNKSYTNIHVVYDKDAIVNTIGEVIQDGGLRQVRIAETEKYPHVTFFLNGGREAEFKGEDRLLCPSPKVATYDLSPEMSAGEITSAITERIKNNAPDFICLNYANADMVGHTGDFNAAMKACEVVDECLKELTETALSHDYEIIIIADHGNSDYMINADGSPNTAHTTNPVPVIYVSNNASDKSISDGKLSDIAPTLLGLMGVAAPVEMTGENIISTSLIQDLKKKVLN